MSPHAKHTPGSSMASTGFTPTMDASEFCAQVTVEKCAICVTSEAAKPLEGALRVTRARLLDAMMTLDRCPKGPWAKTYLEDLRPRMMRALDDGDEALKTKPLPWGNQFLLNPSLNKSTAALSSAQPEAPTE